MIQRFLNLIRSFFGMQLKAAERANVQNLRSQAVDDSAAKIKEARQGLGDLQGQVMSATRLVKRLEVEAGKITARKAHFLAQLKDAAPDSPTATKAKADALKQHTSLATANEELNVARTDLTGLAASYEQQKALIATATESVSDARKKGKRQERNAASAKRRNSVIKTTSGLRGLGLDDSLADFDELIEEGIDALDGAAFVASEFADAENADRRLDADIASQESLGDFEAEVAAMNAATPAAAPDTIPVRNESVSPPVSTQEPTRTSVPTSTESSSFDGDCDSGSGSDD